MGDSRGRVYTWVVSDTQGIYMYNSVSPFLFMLSAYVFITE